MLCDGLRHRLEFAQLANRPLALLAKMTWQPSFWLARLLIANV